MLTAAALVLGLPVPAGALPGLGLVLLAAAGACSAFGLALGALGLRFRDVFLVSNVASSGLLLLTGAAVPRESLPEWMRFAGELLPLTHAADAARRLTAGGGLDGALLGTELAVGRLGAARRRPARRLRARQQAPGHARRDVTGEAGQGVGHYRPSS
ncbi:ABC transporter permease [Streptomyces narbonensis]